MVKCWVECLWAAWAAAAVHVVNMMLKALTLDTLLIVTPLVVKEGNLEFCNPPLNSRGILLF